MTIEEYARDGLATSRVEKEPVDVVRSSGGAAPGLRARDLALAGAVAIAGMLFWFQGRGLASARDSYETRLRQLAEMRVDAARISELRKAPRAAASRDRTNEELLAQIERSLDEAGIDRGLWHDSIPQPPRRLAQSDYRAYATRLYFEGLTLRKLAAFAHDLQADDPTLRVSSIHLGNREPGTPCYDTDLAVSYLVYAPRKRSQTQVGMTRSP